MQLDAIDSLAVRGALRALRYGKPLRGNPLLGLRAFEAYRQRLGAGQAEAARDWAMGRFLSAEIEAALDALRPPAAGATAQREPAAIDLLVEDFASGEVVRQAWGLLQHRYLDPQPLQWAELVPRLGLSAKSLQRRLRRGHQLLAARLRERELALTESPVEPDGRAASPPGTDDSSRAPAARLPRSRSRFFGRERELADLQALLGEAGLVTVVGPGGVGKSRLMIELGRRLLDRSGERLWLVELAQTAEPERLLPTFARALEVEESADIGLREGLGQRLAREPAWLLVDNCEHLLEPCAELLDEILERCPRLRVIATSRAPLGIVGERRFALAPLDVPPAAEAVGLGPDRHYPALDLLLDRVQAQRPGLRLDSDELRAAAQVCRELEGMPLALELAAARARHLTLPEIARRLADPLALLRDGARVDGARHGTMHATIDWSHRLLEPDEAWLFAALGAFPASFQLEDLEAVLRAFVPRSRGGSPRLAGAWIFDAVLRLTDRSLVATTAGEGRTRFHLLAPIHAYARHRLRDLEEAGSLAEAHARHYAERVIRAAESGGRSANRLLELAPEIDHLHAALSWAEAHDPALQLALATALGELWFVLGQPSHGRERLDRALAAPAETTPELQARAWLAWARLVRSQGDYPEATDGLKRALEGFRTCSDAEGCADALRELGSVLEEQGEVEAGEACFRQALDAYRESGSAWGEAAVLNNLGIAADHQGRHSEAMPLLRRSLSLFRALSADWAIGVVLGNLANAAARSARLDEAAELYRQSLRHALSKGDRTGRAHALTNLADVELRLGHRGAAADFLEQARPLLVQLRDRHKLCDWLHTAAALALDRGQPERAAALLRAEECLRRAYGTPRLPSQTEQHDHVVAGLRATLGEGFEWPPAEVASEPAAWAFALACADEHDAVEQD